MTFYIHVLFSFNEFFFFLISKRKQINSEESILRKPHRQSCETGESLITSAQTEFLQSSKNYTMVEITEVKGKKKVKKKKVNCEHRS